MRQYSFTINYIIHDNLTHWSYRVHVDRVPQLAWNLADFWPANKMPNQAKIFERLRNTWITPNIMKLLNFYLIKGTKCSISFWLSAICSLKFSATNSISLDNNNKMRWFKLDIYLTATTCSQTLYTPGRKFLWKTTRGKWKLLCFFQE